jgi:hypothetical protein
VYVVLGLSEQAQRFVAQHRADVDRFEHLRFLHSQIYSNPALVVVERIERHAERLDDTELQHLERLARSLKAGQEWWYPMLSAWEAVVAGINDDNRRQLAMSVLLDAISKLTT